MSIIEVTYGNRVTVTCFDFPRLVRVDRLYPTFISPGQRYRLVIESLIDLRTNTFTAKAAHPIHAPQQTNRSVHEG
jgi:hypothetical protein